MIARLHKHGGVFKTEMSGSTPGGIRLNGDEGFVGPGLHPPRAASRVDDDLLAGMRAGDAAGDGVHALAAALSRRRNFCECDCGAGGRFLRAATAEHNGESGSKTDRPSIATRASDGFMVRDKIPVVFHSNSFQDNRRAEPEPM